MPLQSDSSTQQAGINMASAERPEGARLAVLLAGPIASTVFSAFAIVLGLIGSSPSIVVAQFLLIMAAIFAGAVGLILGSFFLLKQIYEGSIHIMNTVLFNIAWVISALAFVAAMAVLVP